MNCSALPLFVWLFILPLCQDPVAPAASAQKEAAIREPQAKTQEELDAYMVVANQQDATAAETVADDFVSKYPESELKASAYASVMQRHQQAGSVERSIAAGRKVLSIDPSNVMALTMTAANLVETGEKAPDSTARYAEAKKYADTAIAAIDSGAYIPASSAEQLETLKTALRAAAYTSKGMAAFKQNDYAGAEENLKQAVEFKKARPDASVLLHLAIAQDHRKKYSEALASVNQAITIADAQKNIQLGTAARSHKQRLAELVKRTNSKTSAKKR